MLGYIRRLGGPLGSTADPTQTKSGGSIHGQMAQFANHVSGDVGLVSTPVLDVRPKYVAFHSLLLSSYMLLVSYSLQF
jgi:hypothetical protein